MRTDDTRALQESFRQELEAFRKKLDEELEELRKQGQQEVERASLRVEEMAQATLEKVRAEEILKEQALEAERRRLDDLVEARAVEWKEQLLQESEVLRLADAMWRHMMPSLPEKATS